MTLALNSDRCADTETVRRGRNLSGLRNCLLQSPRQEVAGCVSRTARKIVWLEVRMGKGPKRKMGWGFYSECSGKVRRIISRAEVMIIFALRTQYSCI